MRFFLLYFFLLILILCVFHSSSICNPTIKEELAEALTNPENNPTKDMLFKMLQEEEYDFALSFSSGGSDVM